MSAEKELAKKYFEEVKERFPETTAKIEELITTIMEEFDIKELTEEGMYNILIKVVSGITLSFSTKVDSVGSVQSAFDYFIIYLIEREMGSNDFFTSTRQNKTMH